jgi:ribosomal protein S18 acetylase RimI-like enzyme
MDIELIKAQETDRDFLLLLRKITMQGHLEKAGFDLSEQAHIERINKHFDGSYLVLYSKQKIGLLKCVETGDNIEIIQLQILPDYQGKGIGKYLLTQQADKATQLRKKLTLNVLKENPAKLLYERNGFTIVGEDEHEYHMEYVRPV